MTEPQLDIRTLELQYSQQVEEVLGNLKNVIPEAQQELKQHQPDEAGWWCRLDNIWALRFVLSHKGDVAAATEAAQRCIEWRWQKSEWLKAAAQGHLPSSPAIPALTRYLAADVHKCTRQGEPLYIVRAGLSNAPAVMDACSFEDVVDYLMFKREQCFIACDKETRRTGRLTKTIFINDLNFARMANNDTRFFKALAASARLSEVVYPQLLMQGVLVNLPSLFKMVMRPFMALMPAKQRDKTWVCPGRTLKEPISKCPFVRARFGEDLSSLPTFLGGTCSCQGGCICGVANEQTEANLQADEEGMTHALVPSKGSHQVFLEVQLGATLAWACEVEKGTLSGHGSLVFSATLHPSAGGSELTLVSPVKHRSEEGVIKGEVAVPQGGQVIVTWANTSSYFSRGLRCSVAAVAGIPVTAEHGGEHSSDLVVATLTEKTCVDPTGVVGSMKALNVTSSEAAGAGNES